MLGWDLVMSYVQKPHDPGVSSLAHDVQAKFVSIRFDCPFHANQWPLQNQVTHCPFFSEGDRSALWSPLKLHCSNCWPFHAFPSTWERTRWYETKNYRSSVADTRNVAVSVAKQESLEETRWQVWRDLPLRWPGWGNLLQLWCRFRCWSSVRSSANCRLKSSCHGANVVKRSHVKKAYSKRKQNITKSQSRREKSTEYFFHQISRMETMKDPESPLKTSSTTYENATLLHEPSRLSRFLARIWLPGMMPQYRSCLPGSLEKCISHVTHLHLFKEQRKVMIMQIFHHFAENWIGQKKTCSTAISMDHCLAIYHDFEIGWHFTISVFHLAKLGWMAWRNALPLTRLTAASPSPPASPRIFKSPWTSSTTWSVPLPSESMISNLIIIMVKTFSHSDPIRKKNSAIPQLLKSDKLARSRGSSRSSIKACQSLPCFLSCHILFLGESWNSIQKQCWTWKLVTPREWDNLKKYLDTSVLDDQQK